MYLFYNYYFLEFWRNRIPPYLLLLHFAYKCIGFQQSYKLTLCMHFYLFVYFYLYFFCVVLIIFYFKKKTHTQIEIFPFIFKICLPSGMHRDFSLVCVAKNSTANIIQIILPIQTINFSINKIPLNAFEYLFKDSNHSVRGERISTYTYLCLYSNKYYYFIRC